MMLLADKSRRRGPWFYWLGWRYRTFHKFGRVQRIVGHRVLGLGVCFIEWKDRL